MNPNNINKFRTMITMLWSQGLKEQARKMEEEALKKNLHVGSCHTEEKLEEFITQDPAMLELKDTVRILQSQPDPVLIVGESGTGKELIANALHGSRAGKFVTINCPALSVDLMESELFGHVKGAFTGAVNDKIGKFQFAYNGTLFIDEIGDMPLSMQALLLRVLQEKVITRVGDNADIEIKTRIVAATNKDLEAMVSAGTFRLDLLHRINTFVLHTSPLRERREDIKLLIQTWDKTGKFEVHDSHPLQGNVRELWSMYRRWAVLKK